MRTASFAIMLRSGPDMYWCGYEPNPAEPGAGCHVWKQGVEGLLGSVRFADARSAHRAGVGAPSTPYGRGDLEPHRGVRVVELVVYT